MYSLVPSSTELCRVSSCPKSPQIPERRTAATDTGPIFFVIILTVSSRNCLDFITQSADLNLEWLMVNSTVLGHWFSTMYRHKHAALADCLEGPPTVIDNSTHNYIVAANFLYHYTPARQHKSPIHELNYSYADLLVS
jgi:hypothetical protein